MLFKIIKNAKEITPVIVEVVEKNSTFNKQVGWAQIIIAIAAFLGIIFSIISSIHTKKSLDQTQKILKNEWAREFREVFSIYISSDIHLLEKITTNLLVRTSDNFLNNYVSLRLKYFYQLGLLIDESQKEQRKLLVKLNEYNIYFDDEIIRYFKDSKDKDINIDHYFSKVNNYKDDLISIFKSVEMI